MDDDQQLIEELGIEGLSAEEKTNVIDNLTMKIGESLAADLSEAQLQEFQAIIDGDTDIITAWLLNNAPDYKTTPEYEALAEDEGDVPADKLYAYTAWINVNKPDFQDIVEQTKAEVKANVDQYK